MMKMRFDCPEYSFGYHLDDKTKLVIKVTSGEYKDTVFCYNDVVVNEDAEGPYLSYSCELLVYVRDSKVETIGDISHFHETVSNSILGDCLQKEVDKEKE